MFCSFCGKEINESMKFCPNCGKEVAMIFTSQRQDAEEQEASPLQEQQEGQTDNQPNEQQECNEQQEWQPNGQQLGQQTQQTYQPQTHKIDKTNLKEIINGKEGVQATASDVISLCTSKLFLVFCILFTALRLFKIADCHGFGFFIMLIPGAIICVGCWIARSECCNKTGETLGFSLVNGVITLYFAVFALVCGICVLAGAVFTLQNIFEIESISILIACALIGAIFGLLMGLFVVLTVGLYNILCRKFFAGKLKQVEKESLSRDILRMLKIYIAIGVFLGISQVNEAGFAFLLIGVVVAIPASYWLYFRQTTVSAKRVIQGVSSEWKVSTGGSMGYLCILAIIKFIIIRSGGMKYLIASYLAKTELLEDMPDIIINYILNNFVGERKVPIDEITSLAVVVCAYILLWRIVKINKSDERANA